ncbi:MAG: electron transport complex subunit E [Treponema sp.]|nr:electron transport complex subunit E [Candidatus Treponema merdequi]
MKNYFKILSNGVIKENPLLVLSIGLCSSLAVTTEIVNGLGMGVAMTFVLLMSEIIISIFRKHIPDAIRLPIFIIVIAAFTTIVQLLLNAYIPSLAKSLGDFLPLIVVNCIIMGRVEAFASKNNPFAASLDAIGMGLGYTWVLCVISFIRELLGAGTIFGTRVFDESLSCGFFAGAPGGFFVFGLLIAVSECIQNAAKEKGSSK